MLKTTVWPILDRINPHPPPPHPSPNPLRYILEESNFNVRYVRLCDLDIPSEVEIVFVKHYAPNHILVSNII